MSKRSVDQFGPFGRFALITFQTRSGALEYFIQDADTVSDDGTGLPTVLFQTSNRDEAITKKAELLLHTPQPGWD